MIRGILGKKIGMTQIFDTEGNITPVTVVEAGPCTVLGLKDKPKMKVVLGYESVKETRLQTPVLGFFKKVGQAPSKHIKEFESADNKDYKVGDLLKADLFKAGIPVATKTPVIKPSKTPIPAGSTEIRPAKLATA